jgi:hypothetical protein
MAHDSAGVRGIASFRRCRDDAQRLGDPHAIDLQLVRGAPQCCVLAPEIVVPLAQRG